MIPMSIPPAAFIHTYPDDNLADIIAASAKTTHVFVRIRGVVSCAKCGVCWQRDESKNTRPCRGVVRVVPR